MFRNVLKRLDLPGEVRSILEKLDDYRNKRMIFCGKLDFVLQARLSDTSSIVCCELDFFVSRER